MRFFKKWTGIPIILLCLFTFETNCLFAQAKVPVFCAAPGLKTQIKKQDPWFAKDKFDHFIVSAFLTTFSYYSARESLGQPHRTALPVACGITFGLGVGKEVWDKKSKKGMASFRDLAADLLGVGVGLLICRVSS